MVVFSRFPIGVILASFAIIVFWLSFKFISLAEFPIDFMF